MLQNPSAYLEQRNRVLIATGSQTANAYANSLGNVVKAVTGKPDKGKKNPEYIALQINSGSNHLLVT